MNNIKVIILKYEYICRLEPGVIPNAVIVSTIGKLVAANPYGMLSFLKIILTIMLPMLTQIHEEVLKQAVCSSKYIYLNIFDNTNKNCMQLNSLFSVFSNFCEALHDYTRSKEIFVPEINKQMFEEDICSIYDFLMQNWLKTSRDVDTIQTILNALGYIIILLSEQMNSERFIKLLPICLNLSKKSSIRLSSLK